MPLIFGLLALALAVSLSALWWSAAFVAALQVLCVLVLLLFGLVWTVVGYSELKATRELAHAQDEAGTATNSGDTESGSSLSTSASTDS